jgi:hypothetical protein
VLNEFPPRVLLTVRFLITAFQILIHLAHQIRYGDLFNIIFLEKFNYLDKRFIFPLS